MSDIAIRAEGLSKRYVIGEGEPRYLTLRDTITHGLTWPLRMARRFAGNGADDRPTGPTLRRLQPIDPQTPRGPWAYDGQTADLSLRSLG